MEAYYLEFLAFTLSRNYSFEQIQELGQFLRSLAKNGKLCIFSTFSFDSEEISRITNGFGKCLLDDLKADLCSSKFSLCIDNSTVSKTGICGIKVRYLKDYEEKITGLNGQSISILKSKIENRIIGVKKKIS